MMLVSSFFLILLNIVSQVSSSRTFVQATSKLQAVSKKAPGTVKYNGQTIPNPQLLSVYSAPVWSSMIQLVASYAVGSLGNDSESKGKLDAFLASAQDNKKASLNTINGKLFQLQIENNILTLIKSREPTSNDLFFVSALYPVVSIDAINAVFRNSSSVTEAHYLFLGRKRILEQVAKHLCRQPNFKSSLELIAAAEEFGLSEETQIAIESRLPGQSVETVDMLGSFYATPRIPNSPAQKAKTGKEYRLPRIPKEFMDKAQKYETYLEKLLRLFFGQ